jgi:dTDP-4-amino-4,6-dideoxygalactose transaminase
MDRNSFPNSDQWSAEGLSLPLFFGMTDAQAEYVADAVRSFFTR